MVISIFCFRTWANIKLDSDALIRAQNSISVDLCNPQLAMCEQRVPKLQEFQRSLATRVPRVQIQRVEQFPNLMETMVSVFICVCGKNAFNFIYGFTDP
jgi:hypothetical protein